jgi:Glycosyl-hydrolase family 116, catalytic region
MRQEANNKQDTWRSFYAKGERFVEKTTEHILQGVNPGGVYQAIWCRDASYILRDWFMCGNIDGSLQQIFQIWSHQIAPNRDKIVFGRGSPDMNFLAEVADEKTEKKFAGALPTTIYQAGFSEVYGKNPDIDSTALMISTTSWILTTSLIRKEKVFSSPEASKQATIATEHSASYISTLLSKIGITDPSKVIDFILPRMLRSVEYLKKRDRDNDGILEQDHNEDWMDTALRSGKIVYSQACWILALNDLSILLSRIEREPDAERISKLARKAIRGVEKTLWSAENNCYLDLHKINSHDKERILTEDISLYLIAVTDNTVRNSLKLIHSQNETSKTNSMQLGELNEEINERAQGTLRAIKTRAWKEKWPLVTERELVATGPWILKPYEYHNHTFWPWITGLEMLARSRFEKAGDCEYLFSKLALEGHPHIHAFYEWINPINDQENGAYPFRTGISAIRIAIADILAKRNSTN